MSVAGWVLLGLLALPALAFLVPVTVTLRAGGAGFTVWVRFWLFKARVFPLKARAKPPKRPKKPKAARAPKKQSAKKERTREEKTAMLRRLLRGAVAAARPFIRHLRIHGLRLVLPVHAAEAADTARLFAGAQAAVGTVRALAAGRVRLDCRQLEILPDFAGRMGDKFFFTCKISFCPAILFAAGYAFLKTYLSKKE